MTRKASPHRIALCVNACKGFTTAELEDLPGTYAAMAAQCKELIEACEKLIARATGETHEYR